MKPKVSVIIPCYNQGKFLQETLDSVFDSTYENIEVIVVDDDSSDEFTKDFLKKFSDDRVKIIHQANQGVAVARNNGINLAQGEYILPLDGDDKIGREYIEKAVAKMDCYDIVYCEAEFFGRESGKWDLPDYEFLRFLNENCIFVCALFRKSDWAKVGGYKSSMLYGNEDWEFYISLIELGSKVFRIPEVMFFYRKHENSRTDNLSVKRNAESYKEILRLHTKLYLEHLDYMYIFFQNVYGEIIAEKRARKKRTFLQRIYSIDDSPERYIIYFLGFKKSIWKKHK